jgi:hypothetical protein
MVADPHSLSSPSISAARNVATRRERVFFGGMTVALFVAVLVGFGPSYYFRTVAGSPVALSPALHIHGAVFTVWMVLLVVQSTLIAAGRSQLHRQLGAAGAVLAALMMALGAYVAITRFQTGLMEAPPGIPVGALLAIALATVVVFPVLFGAALLLRRRTDFHKRLVLIATLELVTAAVARWPGVLPYGPIAFFALTDLFLVAIAVYDFRTRGRLHPATLWGGLFLIVSQPLRLAIGVSAPWNALAASLTG